MKIKCPNCQDGFVFFEEDGRQVRDACYHCHNTGFISLEQHRIDQIESMAESLADSVVQEMKRDCNNDPDGEGWSFHAAESGVTEHQYTASRMMSKADQFKRSLVALNAIDSQLVSALLDRMSPIVIEDSPPIRLVREEDVEDTDDIPF